MNLRYASLVVLVAALVVPITMPAQADHELGQIRDFVDRQVEWLMRADKEAPTRPSGLSADASKPRKIHLAWNPSSDSGGSGLEAYYINVYTGSACCYGARTTDPFYTDASVVRGQAYTYEVRACDNDGNCSAPSDPVTATAR